MLRDEDRELKQRKFMGNLSLCRTKKMRWRGEEGGMRRFISILLREGRNDKTGGGWRRER